MRNAYLHSPSTAANGVESLENQLKLSLRPVMPSTEFVDHLHDRLTVPVETTVERRQHTALSLLLVTSSLLSGIFLIWLMRRFRNPDCAEPVLSFPEFSI